MNLLQIFLNVNSRFYNHNYIFHLSILKWLMEWSDVICIAWWNCLTFFSITP